MISKALFLFISVLFWNLIPSNLFAQIPQDECLVIERDLSLGSKGADVSLLQDFLIKKSYDIPAISNRNAAKGFFGMETQTAVVAYQANKSLPKTGFVGPITRKSIESECKSVTATEPPVISLAISTSTPPEPVAVAPTTKEVTLTNTKSLYSLIENEGKTPMKAIVTFEFTVVNGSDKDIYIGNKAGNSLVAIMFKGTGALSTTLMSANPNMMEGDTDLAYVVPKNKSRVFVSTGRVDNTKGREGIQSVLVKEIPYSNSSSLTKLAKLIPFTLKTEFKLGGGF